MRNTSNKLFSFLLIGTMFILVCGGSLAISQESLTNDAIIKMVKAGMSESLIVSMINQQPGNYAMKVDDLIALKQAGTSDKIVAAIAAKGSGGATAAAAPTLSASTPPSQAMEIGVHFKKAEGWVEILPEIVNWRTGGALKSFATGGVVKKDLNGNLTGPTSRNSVKSPLEFMIVASEGVSITEYQLIRLRTTKDYREFRTVTGGILNSQSGAMRDVIPFEGKKLSPRNFTVILPNNLGAGEYGFLAPGAVGSSGNAAAQIGKMYTFRFIE